MLTTEAIERLQERQGLARQQAARMDVAAQFMCSRAVEMREQAAEQKATVAALRRRRKLSAH